ncbi:10025_t:CDS:2 [Paraglomus occultum]|uniref:10025_t:CDS:1 n=1 Tax=Paraglomus occultum TaxID=144539 RepID=A0A9N9FIV3_9GLOM|nr:10025_t:CDS:2 [Paraglomus occultum]
MKRLRQRETVGSKQLRVVIKRRPADFIAQSLWGLFNTKGACGREKLSEASNGESPSSADLRDWETWLQEKTAILIRRGVRNTNLNLHGEINMLALNKGESSAKNTNSNPDPDVSEEDQEEEEGVDEIDEFFMDKGNNDKIRNDDISDDNGNNINFIERIEESKPMSSTSQHPWILRSGTNVGDKLTSYVKTIPEAQKCLNFAYWNILDLTENTQIKSLFSTNDWEEMVERFNNEVKLIESDFLDVVEYFFDEVEKIIKISSTQSIDKPQKLLKRIENAENLERVDLPVSEAGFDNAFPNMLAKRFLNREELKMVSCRRNEGRSVVLRARIGQKCDFRGTLKKSINRLEALIGLRSGGLPEPHQKKICEDKVDLSVAMRDILYTFFKENSKAPSSDIHSTFVFGIHSWGN